VTDRSDSDLVSAVREGGRDAVGAYEELVRRHQRAAVRLATYLLSGSDEGEDVAQEAFVRAFTHLGSARPDTTFGPWLRTIVTRLCFNHRRDARVRRGEDESEPGAKAPSSARSAVEWTLSQLAYPYREILILRFVEEMSIEEIAETLGLGASAAKMRLSRARERFLSIFHAEHA
jgi:RNA polymerase sigma-70 factor (ECF subfamily)